MVQAVEAQRISFATLFKILFIGNLIFSTLVLILSSILSFIGFEVFKVDDAYLTGTEGLTTGLLSIPLMLLLALFWSGFFWIGYTISLWIYSKWRPMTISYIPKQDLNKD